MLAKKAPVHIYVFLLLRYEDDLQLSDQATTRYQLQPAMY